MSNNSGVEITGIDEILANIDKIGLNVRKVTKEALTNGAKIVKDELESNTPESMYEDVHIKDHILISNLRKDKETDEDYVLVGTPKGLKHRWHFFEFGTIKQQPQKVMTRAIESTKLEVNNEIKNTLKGALKL